ncbi:hypothetical protein GCM10023317_63130 [Actinopolymorpha pittospori]
MMRPLRIALLVSGAFALLIGFGLMLAGSTLLSGYFTQRDDSGVVSSPQARYAVPSFAMTATQTGLRVQPGVLGWLPAHRIDAVRIDATRVDGGQLFLGVARRAEVERYLHGSAVARADFRRAPFALRYHPVAGDQRPRPPARQGVWAATSTGGGTQHLTWPLRDGDWTVVVMNADAAKGVDVHLSVGARSPAVRAIGVSLFAGGGLLGGVGALLVYAACRRARPGTDVALIQALARREALSRAERPSRFGAKS